MQCYDLLRQSAYDFIEIANVVSTVLSRVGEVSCLDEVKYMRLLSVTSTLDCSNGSRRVKYYADIGYVQSM